MRRRVLKKKILTLLEEKQWPEVITEIQKYRHRDIVNHLFTSLCSTTEICKWHGVSCFGIIVPQIAEQDLESARLIMRRFLWCLNDESGGIGWGIPEAMAEVMVHHEVLFDEYCHMLLSYMRDDGPGLFQDGNYLELPALQQGLLWGVGRLLEKRSTEMIARGVRDDLPQYLTSPNQIVQAMAIWCLGQCGAREVIEDLQSFCDSSYSLQFYQGYTLHRVTIGDLATRAIQSIENC